VTKEADELISIREAARALGVHPSTLRNWDRAGRLRAVRVGSRRDRRFNKSEVLAQARAQAPGSRAAEIAKALGTTPAALSEIVAQCQAAVDALQPFALADKHLRDSMAHAVGVMDPLRGFEDLSRKFLEYPFGHLSAQVLDNVPNFGELLEPIVSEQNLLGDRMREYVGSLFDAETFSSGIYAGLAATQAELFSTQAIAALAGSFKAADIVGAGSLVWDQITANIGAYQDLTRAALWDLDAMSLAGDKRLPFAEMKLAGGLLQSATTLVADLPAGAGDAPGATVKKPNLLRHFHRQVQGLEATEQLNHLELEAQVKDLRSFRAGNVGLWIVEQWRHINRAAQLNGRDPIFEPSVDVVGVAARLPLSFAGDETELGELIDGLYKLIFEASGDGRRVRVLAEPHEYETVRDIVVLRHYYRHDQAQGRSLHDSRRNFARVGDVFERLIGKRLPSSPADWQRVCLGLMRRAEGFLRAIADRFEGKE